MNMIHEKQKQLHCFVSGCRGVGDLKVPKKETSHVLDIYLKQNGKKKRIISRKEYLFTVKHSNPMKFTFIIQNM